jgi:ribosomal protein S27E
MAEEKTCDCIFCNFKCPECGSTDIYVRFKAETLITSFVRNKLKFSFDGFRDFEVECHYCGETYIEVDAQNLLEAIMKFLNRTHVRLTEDHRIVFEDSGTDRMETEVLHHGKS